MDWPKGTWGVVGGVRVTSATVGNTTRNIQCSPFLVVIPEKGPQVIQVGRGVSNLSCILTGFLHKFTKINFSG
jgi:hypothetical protein